MLAPHDSSPVKFCLFQEIDGLALILLEREDILENLGLRLGPALKVFELVKKLKEKHFLQNQL